MNQGKGSFHKNAPAGRPGHSREQGLQVSLTAYMPEPRDFNFEDALPADQNHKSNWPNFTDELIALENSCIENGNDWSNFQNGTRLGRKS